MKEPGCKAADKSHECTCQEHQEGPSPSSGSDALIFDRKKLLEITSRLIEETHERISGDRFRLREGDKERLQYLRALTGLIALHTALLEKANSPPLEGYSRKRDPVSDRISADLDRLMSEW
jgi:hypothetical protein